MSVALESDDLGECDMCPAAYELASRDDHCVDEGRCWEHCTSPEEHLTAQLREIGVEG